MTPATLPDEASPLTDELDGPLIHEERLPPVKLREPNEADVIVAMGLTWGCGFTETHRRLRKMNFVDYDFSGVSNDA